MQPVCSSIAFVLILVAGARSLQADEVLTLDTTSSTGVWSQPLVAGKTYEFKAEGTWGYNAANWPADAEFIDQVSANPPGWYEFETPDVGGGPGVADIVIDGVPVDWLGTTDGFSFTPHTFSPSHIYKYYYVGQGLPVNFHIQDPCYSDNSGSLTITVPEPASLIMAAMGGLLVMRRRTKY